MIHLMCMLDVSKKMLNNALCVYITITYQSGVSGVSRGGHGPKNIVALSAPKMQNELLFASFATNVPPKCHVRVQTQKFSACSTGSIVLYLHSHRS